MPLLSRREFVREAAGGLAAALASRPAWPAADSAPPNVLYVFADQLRFCALGCTGEPTIRTPHLDRLANQGLLLENAFSCTPVCTPYRAQLLTGRYGHATGVTTNDQKLPEREVTLAEILREHGYATGYIGKWHLEGGRRAPVGDPRRQGYVPSGASRQGFDYWAALECGHNYFHTRYYRDDATPIAVDGYEPAVQTDLAIEFLKQARERPFLLLLSFGPPHDPYQPPPEWDLYDPAKVTLRPNVPADLAATARRSIAQYYGLVSSLDHCVGRLMAALDDLGLSQTTLLCFTSDHGDMLYSQGHRLKQRPWEEAAHVPFLMRFPNRLAAGQRRDTLLGSVDIMPTLLGFCGARAPTTVHGRNLAPLLLGTAGDEPDSVYLYNAGTGGAGGLVYPWRAVRTKEWLYAWSSDPQLPDGDWLLYHLPTDPYQQTNRISDATCRAERDRLRDRLERWRRETGEDLKLGLTRQPGEPAPTAGEPVGDNLIDFPTAGPAVRWQAAGETREVTLRDGALLVVASGSRPTLECRPIRLAASRVARVRVRLVATAGDQVTLSWTAEGLPRFSQPKSLTLPLQADGQPHDYDFQVASSALWQDKTITALRLQVVAATGQPTGLRIDRIEGLAAAR